VATGTEKVKVDYAVLPGQDDLGQPIFSLLVKRTYDIKPGLVLVRAEKDQPLRSIDEYYDMGDAQTSTIQYESDLAPFKSHTDVVFIGKAMAPGGTPVLTMDVGIQVEGVGAKVIRVIGNRRCIYQAGRAPLFTQPIPFTEMEIRYDLAYGGKDKKSNPDNPFHFPSNDMGKGMVLKNKKELVEGLELPNLEDPRDLLTPDKAILDTPEMWPRQPMPQGLGWFQKTWYPRSFFAGSCPAYVEPGTVTKEEFLGYVQKDHIAQSRRFKLPAFHTRFLQGASPGLYFPALKGNETIRLKGLTPEGLLQFSLPDETPKLNLDIGFGAKDLNPVMHTVMIRAEERQVDIVWRGSQPYPGIDWLPEMTTLVVDVG
jgi:hypothetical protein